MSSFYVSARATAHELLTEFGQAVPMTRVVEGDYDPETATAAREEVTQYVVACGFPVDEKMVNGSSILSGDMSFIVSADKITAPQVGDTLAWTDGVYRVVSVKPLAPAGYVVLYELLGRR